MVGQQTDLTICQSRKDLAVCQETIETREVPSFLCFGLVRGLHVRQPISGRCGCGRADRFRSAPQRLDQTVKQRAAIAQIGMILGGLVGWQAANHIAGDRVENFYEDFGFVGVLAEPRPENPAFHFDQLGALLAFFVGRHYTVGIFDIPEAGGDRAGIGVGDRFDAFYALHVTLQSSSHGDFELPFGRSTTHVNVACTL